VTRKSELLAKLLVYNVTVSILEIYEHGVIPDVLRDPACVGKEVRVSEVAPPR
jgi:hypothetical protein